MRNATSLAGKDMGLTSDRLVMAPTGFVSGEHGSQFYHPSPSMVSLWDDFTGDSVDAQWDAKTGSDGSVVTPTVNAQVNGVVRLTTGAGATTTMAVNGVQLQRFLCWKSNQGHLCLETRIKLSAITNICVYAGFGDQVASLGMPINSASSGDTITTNISNGCGFMFDTAMATANWWLVGVAADVDATSQNSTIAPVVATYEVLRIQLSTTGVATFFRNGKQVGTTMTGATTATTSLTPIIAAFTRSAASATVDLDYVAVMANRT